MPRKAKATKRWVPAASRPGEAASSSSRGRGADADRLSALPDALLHHVMSFMKAWDVARTCVLSRRWRDLWASAPCVDVRVGRYSRPPEDFAKFVYRLLLAREALAPVDTLRLRSPGEDEDDYDDCDVKMWVRHAIRLNAHNSCIIIPVVLRRELMNCPTFNNLKTLAIGEWCISTGADFDILILLLQHSPCLEKLDLQLEMNSDIQKALGRGTKPKGGSFACKHLSMVKIRCTKDDPRVHMLAQLFRSNGVPLEKICVRRSGSFYLRNLKQERSITINELRECDPY